MMKAAVLTRPGRFEIKPLAVPKLGLGEALIKIARVGICGRDLVIESVGSPALYVQAMGQDMHHALTLLTHGRIKAEAFTRASYPLDDIQAAFDSYADRPADLKTHITMEHTP